MTTGNKGYLLGKLFAQLEREGAVRATDYQVASAAPTSVIVPAFSRLAEMRRLDAIQEAMGELPLDAFSDGAMSSEDQGSFPLGYYHEKAKAIQGEESDEQLSANLLIRLEPSLKAWVMEQGGSEYVRRLLRKSRPR